jgi:hypothetical protein
MNTRTLIAAAAASFAFAGLSGLAHAEGPLEDGRLFIDAPAHAATAPLARDAVRSQIATAPEAVRALHTEAGAPLRAQPAQSGLTRAEVMAQVRSALNNGQYFALVAETNSFDGTTLGPAAGGVRVATAGSR